MVTQELERLAELHRQGALTESEYAQAKARVLGTAGSPTPGEAGWKPPIGSSLRRSRQSRWIAGVCGGIARATGSEAWMWRLALVLFALFGGSGILAYILLWIFIPSES